MILFAKLVKESLLFAINAIVVNKLRTVLSLLGITIGILSVISVFTIFDSMELFVRKNLESLGDNVVFVRKWPQFEMNFDYPWWDYVKRPNVQYDELAKVERMSNTMAFGVFFVADNRTVEHRGKDLTNTTIVGVSHDYDKVLSVELWKGRYYTELESRAGKNVCLLGYDIYKNLFGESTALGKEVKVYGRKLKVIGIIAREGEDNMGSSFDNQLIVPVNFMRNIININRERYGPTIIIKGKDGISNQELKDELTGVFRSIRRLKPDVRDNFTIEEITLLAKMLDNLFGVFALVGWIIGGFSLLVGGFGIANIMFVSVRERTGQIGIQKSLGAKRMFILSQFLFESVFLCVIGGAVGLLLVYLLTLLANQSMEFELILTASNIILAMVVSISIGLVFGIIPAYSASKLDPVEAIRMNA